MSRLVLELRVRQLRQYLVVAAAVGVIGVWVGHQLTPVPGRLFADVAEVPLIYFSPLILAVSLAQHVPGRTYWIERGSSAKVTLAAFAAGSFVAFVPPLVATGTVEVCLISARNGVVLGCLALAARAYLSAAAATAMVLVPNLAIWTFGWDAVGEPHSWALTLSAPEAKAPLMLAGTLLAVHLCRVGGLPVTRVSGRRSHSQPRLLKANHSTTPAPTIRTRDRG